MSSVRRTAADVSDQARRPPVPRQSIRYMEASCGRWSPERTIVGRHDEGGYYWCPIIAFTRGYRGLAGKFRYICDGTQHAWRKLSYRLLLSKQLVD
jgi:hypothetical protein